MWWFIAGLLIGGSSKKTEINAPNKVVEQTIVIQKGNLIDVYGGDCTLYKKYPRKINENEFKSITTINNKCKEILTYTQGYVHIPSDK